MRDGGGAANCGDMGGPGLGKCVWGREHCRMNGVVFPKEGLATPLLKQQAKVGVSAVSLGTKREPLTVRKG